MMALRIILLYLLVAAVSGSATVGRIEKEDVEKEAPIEDNDEEMYHQYDTDDDVGEREDDWDRAGGDEMEMDRLSMNTNDAKYFVKLTANPKKLALSGKECLARAKKDTKRLLLLNKLHIVKASKFVATKTPKTQKQMFSWAKHMIVYYSYLRKQDKDLNACAVKFSKNAPSNVTKAIKTAIASMRQSKTPEAVLAKMSCPTLARNVTNSLVRLDKYYMPKQKHFLKMKIDGVNGMHLWLQYAIPYLTMLNSKSPATKACIKKYSVKNKLKPKKPKTTKRREFVRKMFIRFFLGKIFRLSSARLRLMRALRFDLFILRFSNPILHSILVKKAAIRRVNRAIRKYAILLALTKSRKFQYKRIMKKPSLK
jgi:hypothetical protein